MSAHLAQVRMTGFLPVRRGRSHGVLEELQYIHRDLKSGDIGWDEENVEARTGDLNREGKGDIVSFDPPARQWTAQLGSTDGTGDFTARKWARSDSRTPNAIRTTSRSPT